MTNAAQVRRYPAANPFAQTNLFTLGKSPIRVRPLHGAGVAELVDAADSKSASRKGVKVRFLSPVPFFYSCIAELDVRNNNRLKAKERRDNI